MSGILFNEPCGGCGEKYASKRCFNCHHETAATAALKPSGDAGEVVERLKRWARQLKGRSGASGARSYTDRMAVDDADAAAVMSEAAATITTLERQFATARDLVERAFKDGLAYGNNVANADPDVAWQQSKVRALTHGVSDAE